MKQRLVEPEVMDDPSLDAAAHRAALRGLERLNRLGGVSRVLLRSIRDLVAPGGQPLRVLDVATGGGDVPIGLYRRAERAGMPLEVHGCDLSPVAVGYARERTDRLGAAVRFFQLDALRDPLPEGYDIVTCSLFLHHLAREDAVKLLRKMAGAARRRVVVTDLERRRRHGWWIWLATRLVTRSPVVHTDGPRSARAAFTLDEARQLARDAGLVDARLRPCHPCRFLLTWDKR